MPAAQIVGGAEGDRTPDLRIANATLSQLSYAPGILMLTPMIRRNWMGGHGLMFNVKRYILLA